MTSSHRVRAEIMLALCGILLAGSAGCGMKASNFKPSKMFSLDNSWPFDDDELEEGTPVRVVGAWTDTVMTRPGEKPQRGFGGRLAFYDGESEKAILVDGQLVVYAFDESGRDPTDNKPTRRYVFPAEQLPQHMSESDLGATYSFWLPWDEAGGPQTEVSLICRFQPKKGQIVISEQTKHRLPGSLPSGGAVAHRQPPALPEGVPSRPAQVTLESLRKQPAADGATRLASYEAPTASQQVAPATPMTAAAQPRQMTVTSISLPDNFQLRDFAAAAQLASARPHAAAGQPVISAPHGPSATAQQQVVPVQAMAPTPQLAPGGAIASLQVPATVPPAASSGTVSPPVQPSTGLPRVYAPPTTAFSTPTYTAQPPVPQPFPVPNVQQVMAPSAMAQPQHHQPTPQVIQVPAGQPMPAATPTRTTVTYP